MKTKMIILVAAVGAVWTACAAVDAKGFLQRAQEAMKKGEYEEGAKLAEKSIVYEQNVFDSARTALECRLKLPNREEAWVWIEKLAQKYKSKPWIARDLMNLYGFYSYRNFYPDGVRKALAFLKKIKQKPGFYDGRWRATARMFDALEFFPRAEAEITFPAAPTWFGTTKRKTVHVKDLNTKPDIIPEDPLEITQEIDDDIKVDSLADKAFAANAKDDMTAVIQKAIDDPEVGTIIFDKKDTPWRISSLKLCSNKVLVFESGVRILATELSQRGNKEGTDLFKVENVSNVVFVGKGATPADVRIGIYADYEQRRKFCLDYGGSGFTLSGSKNIVIQNLTVADCSMDGLSLSGLGEINKDIYVKDVVFESNYRQACSICNVEDIYFKNVAFNDTRGNSPMCGIDIEPSIQEVQAAFGIYLFDCTFKGNVGSHLNFSCSSAYPVTLYAKRCVFEPNPAGCLEIFPLPSIYFAAKVAAPSNVIFDECRFRQYADKKAINLNHATFFNVTFRNSIVEDVGLSGRGTEAWGAPVAFNLGRSFGKPMGDVDKPGKIVFDNLQVKGYKKSPVIRVCDTKGTYSVTNLHGAIVHNGKKVDVKKFRHIAPEAHLPNSKPFDPAAYAPLKNEKRLADAKFTAVPMDMNLSAGGPWFEPKPNYAAIYWDGTAWVTRELKDDLSELAGKPVAYISQNGFACQIGSRKGLDFNDIYFEVPAGGKEYTIRLHGPCEVRDPAGRIVGSFAWDKPDAPNGAKYVKVKAKSKKAEIWSVRIRKWATVKFLYPLTGVFAEKPEWLPRLKQ